jgi:hypothetical protein
MSDLKELKNSILLGLVDVSDALQAMKNPDSATSEELWDLMTDMQDTAGKMEEWYEELVGVEEDEED